MALLATSLLVLLAASPSLAGSDPAGAPPVEEPPVEEQRYHYRGAAGEGEYSLQQIAELVRSEPGGEHDLWQPGWSDWKPWREVPELVALVEQAPAPPPPAPAPVAAPHPPAPVPVAAPHPPAPAPVAAPPPPAPAPVAAPPRSAARPPRPRVRLGGELRFFGLLEPVDLVPAEGEEAREPVPDFQLARARIRADARVAEHVRGRINIELRPQDMSETVAVEGLEGADEGYADSAAPTVTVDGEPDGWADRVKDAYLTFSMEKAEQRLRLGLQKTVFGTRDYFNAFDRYYMGGWKAHQALPLRAKVVPSRDLGLAYHLAPVDAAELDLQLLDGNGGALGDDAYKQLVGRARFHPLDFLELQASGQFEPTAEGSRYAYDASLELRGGSLRGIAEFVGGEDGTPFLGYSATAAWDLGLRAESLDRLSLVGRYLYFDPDTGGDYPDAWALGELAGLVYWRSPQVLATGLLAEVEVPQSMSEPVALSLVAQTTWKF